MKPHSVPSEAPGRPHAGRPSFDTRLDDMALALRVVDDPDALGRLRLARDPRVVARAEARYGRVTGLSRGCALRDLLKLCLRRVAESSGGPMAGFARAYAEQMPIAQIARQLGMSRAHLSRVYRPRLVVLVTDEFLAELRRDGAESTSGSFADDSRPGRSDG